MKKIYCLLLLILILNSCTKNLDENIATVNDGSIFTNTVNTLSSISDTSKNDKHLIYKPLTDKEKDSIKIIEETSKSVSSLMSLTSQGPEYSDYSGHIHLCVFTNNTTVKTNHPVVSVSVSSSYAMVGGGALAYGMTGNGAFLVETRPINSTTWRAQSKDHIVQDPHYLKVYAIGMRIDGVDPSYLRSKIHIVSATGSSDSWPSASISVPVNCILVGGGAIDNYTGYGNMLTDSHPISNEWNAGGKDYRRVDESTITVYAIGIENISYPTVGYLYVTTNQTAAGINLGIGYCNAEVNSGFALTCPGGYDTWHNYGRMLVGLYPQDLVPSTEVISNDTPGYGDYGTNYAFAVGIEQRPW